MKRKKQFAKSPLKWRKYLFEFLSIFFAVSFAFALNTWGESRSRTASEIKTLEEIRNGLNQDLADMQLNQKGHNSGIRACQYFRKMLHNDSISMDSFPEHFHYLMRDFLAIQNVSGYESLKSHGLELVHNDALRLEIIGLYDFHYEILTKLEESYHESQLNQNYFNEIGHILVEKLEYAPDGSVVAIELPLQLNAHDFAIMELYINRIEGNRKFTLKNYKAVESKVHHLIRLIEAELEAF